MMLESDPWEDTQTASLTIRSFGVEGSEGSEVNGSQPGTKCILYLHGAYQ